jgi:hypothetical protein
VGLGAAGVSDDRGWCPLSPYKWLEGAKLSDV